MGGRYDAGMEYAPPELKVWLEDSTTALNIWGEVTPQVLAAQQFALDNDGIYIVNSVGSKGNVQCKVNASPSIIGFVREAVNSFKNISSRESAERVSNNPTEFYFSGDNNRLYGEAYHCENEVEG